MRPGSLLVIPLVGCASALVVACTGPASQGPSGSSASSGQTSQGSLAADAAPSSSGASPSASGSSATVPSGTPSVVSSAAVASLFDEPITGDDLRIVSERPGTSAYTSQVISYRANGLLITGLLNTPRGDGPFPVVVAAHGYINPETYYTGQGFSREQDYLPRRGYAVLHVDYRGHAGSDADPAAMERLRLGYAEDVIAAALALRTTSIPALDPDRVAILGRSMGGGVALTALVAQPGLFDAAVLYSSVSSDAGENFNRWSRMSGVGEAIAAVHGTPESNPEFWRAASPWPHFDRITEPVLVHHGTDDQTCPVSYSRDIVDRLAAADVDVTYREYPGQDHLFWSAWQKSIETTADFLDQHV